MFIVASGGVLIKFNTFYYSDYHYVSEDFVLFNIRPKVCQSIDGILQKVTILQNKATMQSFLNICIVVAKRRNK